MICCSTKEMIATCMLLHSSAPVKEEKVLKPTLGAQTSWPSSWICFMFYHVDYIYEYPNEEGRF
jgi:hypothetical protein